MKGIVEKRTELGGWVSNLKLEDQNSVGVAETVISCAHSWSSFSGRLTRVLTGYFFIGIERLQATADK